jgi:hypothetical protein
VEIISTEAKAFTNSEFVKCCLVAVAEEVYLDKTKILQDISLEHIECLFMNLE